MTDEYEATLAAIERARAYRARIMEGEGLLIDGPSQFTAADFDLVLAAASRGAKVVSIQQIDLRNMHLRHPENKEE